MDCLFCTIYFPIVAKNHYLGLQQFFYIKYELLEKEGRRENEIKLERVNGTFDCTFFNELYLGYSAASAILF